MRCRLSLSRRILAIKVHRRSASNLPICPSIEQEQDVTALQPLSHCHVGMLITSRECQSNELMLIGDPQQMEGRQDLHSRVASVGRRDYAFAAIGWRSVCLVLGGRRCCCAGDNSDEKKFHVAPPWVSDFVHYRHPRPDTRRQLAVEQSSLESSTRAQVRLLATGLCRYHCKILDSRSFDYADCNSSPPAPSVGVVAQYPGIKRFLEIPESPCREVPQPLFAY